MFGNNRRQRGSYPFVPDQDIFSHTFSSVIKCIYNEDYAYLGTALLAENSHKMSYREYTC